MVACSGSDAELAGLDKLPASAQLLLDVQGFLQPGGGLDVTRLQGVLERTQARNFNLSLSLTPLRSNLLQIPELIRFCSEQNVPRFKLPNAHIGDSFHQYSVDDLPRWQDLESFSVVWQEFIQDMPDLPAMDIHDLFLWEIMTPGQEKARSEYGGCQAGNSLAHVDVAGIVHPCAAWPQPLGRLSEQSLDEVWGGQARHAIVEEIAKNPAGCKGCNDLDICFGGCRGLGKFLNQKNSGRDLMCREPR
jgi:GeoRSP system SPASM domain protein